MPHVVWAEESKNGLRFEIRPSYDVVPTRSQLVTHAQSSRTLWTDPNPVLLSLTGIPNHWLKDGLWVYNPPWLLQPLSPNPSGWSTSDPLLATNQTIEWPSVLSVPWPIFHRSVSKMGPISSTGPDLLLCKCHFLKSLKDLIS